MGAQCALLRRERLAQAEGHVDGVGDEEGDEGEGGGEGDGGGGSADAGEHEGEDVFVNEYADGGGVYDVDDEDELEEFVPGVGGA